jgi:MFS family permease
MTTPTAPAKTGPSSGDLRGSVHQREGRFFTSGLGLFNLGSYMAILTPVTITLALKIQALVGNEDKAAAFGLTAAIGAIFAILFNPLGGRLSDRTVARFGMRRPWIIGGAIGGVLSLLLIAVANSLWMVILGWCLVEIFINSAQAAANATMADQVPDYRRGAVSGIVGLGLPIALLVGSIIVNAFAGEVARFVVPGGLMVLFAIFFCVVLRDRRLEKKDVPRFSMKEFWMSFVFNPRKYPDFGWLWIGRFSIMFGYSGVQTYLVYLMSDRFNLAGGTLTADLVFNNLASAVATIVSSFIMGFISDRVHRRRFFVAFAGVFIAIGLGMIAFAPNPAFIVLASAVLGFGGGGFFAVDLALATEVLPHKENTGKDLGVLVITNGLPQSIAPAIAPGIIALGGAAISGYSLLYLVGAVVALLGSVFVYRIKGAR